MTNYYDLGHYRRPISTKSTEAQTWFDRGLVWCYAFNHEEAVRCFQKATEHDPGCAMAWWGVAYAAGPNYNKQWKVFAPADLGRSLKLAFDATQRAVALIQHANPVERALIAPLAERYPTNNPAEATPEATLVWNDRYADRLREVTRTHREDPDVSAILAEALMNRTPWQLWDVRSGKPAEGASTLEALEVLEAA